jgi:L-threonylcarbamoyladenylate synthase
LLAVKGRDAGRGISVLIPDLAAAARWVCGPIAPDAVRLAEKYWPGPITLVLPAAADVDPRLIGPDGGVGLRVSSDPVAARLLALAALPLTSTSANPSGLAPATDALQAREYFADAVDVYVDAGPRTASAVSTVVEFLDGRAYLRRDGAISSNAVAEIVALEY